MQLFYFTGQNTSQEEAESELEVRKSSVLMPRFSSSIDIHTTKKDVCFCSCMQIP